MTCMKSTGEPQFSVIRLSLCPMAVCILSLSRVVGLMSSYSTYLYELLLTDDISYTAFDISVSACFAHLSELY